MGERTGRTCLTWARQGLGRDLDARCPSTEQKCAVCAREDDLAAIEKRAAIAPAPSGGGGFVNDTSETAQIIALSEQVGEVTADRDRLAAENAELRKALEGLVARVAADLRYNDRSRGPGVAELVRAQEALNAKR